MAHGLSCSEACVIFQDQGLNLCLLLWQADSLPLSHQGSPWLHRKHGVLLKNHFLQPLKQVGSYHPPFKPGSSRAKIRTQATQGSGGTSAQTLNQHSLPSGPPHLQSL